MKKKLPTLDDKQLQAGIDEFITKLAKIDQDRVELCKFLARLVDHNRFTLHYVNRMCPKLSMHKLKLMERVGRDDFHPSLLDAVTPGECMLAKMDYQEQVRGIDEDGTVPVMTMDESGKFGMTLLPIRSLTTDQVNQISRVVGGKRVYISEDEQKAWLVDHRTNLATRPSLKPDQPKWKVVDGTVVFLQKYMKLTKAEEIGKLIVDLTKDLNASERATVFSILFSATHAAPDSAPIPAELPVSDPVNDGAKQTPKPLTWRKQAKMRAEFQPAS